MTGNAMSLILRKIMEMRLNKEILDKSAKILIKEILQTVRFEDGNVREATEEIDRMFCGHCGRRIPVTFSVKTVSESSLPPILKKLMLITRQHEEKCVNFSEDMDS